MQKRQERNCASSANGNFKRYQIFARERSKCISKLTSTHYRRSPLVQGGIEIPCVVTVSMPGTVINQLLMERYKQLVETLYTEPKESEILGTEKEKETEVSSRE